VHVLALNGVPVSKEQFEAVIDLNVSRSECYSVSLNFAGI